MVSLIKTLLPSRAEPLVIWTWYFFRPVVRITFLGRARYCPVCRSHCRRFLSHGPRSRKVRDAVCPVCLSHPRHRLAWLFLTTRTDLLDGHQKKVLHIAPEPAFAQILRKTRGIEDVSADLDSPHAMIKLDITRMDRENASFDIILCSHVLEHVPEDRQAMHELFRVLKPGGWAMIQVPVSNNPTFEDPSITDPAERERLFWKTDHVRLYGLDISDRLRTAGFEVDAVFGYQLAEPDRLVETGIYPKDVVFHCRKRRS
jgi:methyltransferase family protein